jgi:hypothetical protein
MKAEKPPNPRKTPGFEEADGPERRGYRYQLEDLSGAVWVDIDPERLAEHIAAQNRKIRPPASADRAQS